jgi:hypothetical protein
LKESYFLLENTTKVKLERCAALIKQFIVAFRFQDEAKAE